MAECYYPECDSWAIAEYEGILPPDGTIRRKACQEHGSGALVRYLPSDAGEEQ